MVGVSSPQGCYPHLAGSNSHISKLNQNISHTPTLPKSQKHIVIHHIWPLAGSNPHLLLSNVIYSHPWIPERMGLPGTGGFEMLRIQAKKTLVTAGSRTQENTWRFPSISMGVPKDSWLVYIKENPKKKGMI